MPRRYPPRQRQPRGPVATKTARRLGLPVGSHWCCDPTCYSCYSVPATTVYGGGPEAIKRLHTNQHRIRPFSRPSSGTSQFVKNSCSHWFVSKLTPAGEHLQLFGSLLGASSSI